MVREMAAIGTGAKGRLVRNPFIRFALNLRPDKERCGDRHYRS